MTAEKIEKPQNKSVTVTIPQDVYDFLDAKHWENRTKLSNIIREGVQAHAVKLGFGKDESAKNVG